jgi:hypothetical protein
VVAQRDRSKVDPKLGPWGDLLAGSPAINSAGTGCPSVDLHGTARPRGTACDVGGIEYPN